MMFGFLFLYPLNVNFPTQNILCSTIDLSKNAKNIVFRPKTLKKYVGLRIFFM